MNNYFFDGRADFYHAPANNMQAPSSSYLSDLSNEVKMRTTIPLNVANGYCCVPPDSLVNQTEKSPSSTVPLSATMQTINIPQIPTRTKELSSSSQITAAEAQAQAVVMRTNTSTSSM